MSHLHLHCVPLTLPHSLIHAHSFLHCCRVSPRQVKQHGEWLVTIDHIVHLSNKGQGRQCMPGTSFIWGRASTDIDGQPGMLKGINQHACLVQAAFQALGCISSLQKLAVTAFYCSSDHEVCTLSCGQYRCVIISLVLIEVQNLWPMREVRNICHMLTL